MKSWRNNFLPAMAWLGATALLASHDVNPITVLMIFRNLLVVGCFLVRAEPMAMADPIRRWLSRGAALVPMLLSWSATTGPVDLLGLGLVLSGTAIVCLAFIDLGSSFGVAPAVRPYVENGIYRFISHPMYAGHFLTEAGMLMTTPTLRNVAVVAVSWSFYALRMKWESELIQSFSAGSWTPAGRKPENSLSSGMCREAIQARVRNRGRDLAQPRHSISFFAAASAPRSGEICT